MTIQLITDPEQLRGLESVWNHAFAKSDDSSIFNHFKYVCTAWRHFSKDTDRLYVIVLRRDGAITAIAPWFISIQRHAGRPVRMLLSIGLLEGDKPGIIVVGSPDAAWGEIARFLRTRWRDWDILRLDEISEQQALAVGFLFRGLGRFKSEVAHQFESYFISMHGSWEQYLRERGNNIRKQYQRRQRRLSEKFGPVEYLFFETPQEIKQGLKRFVELEQESWKKRAGIGISRETQSLGFYEELLPDLARQKMAEVCLLRANGNDIAADVYFKAGGKVYDRETTYNPEYASYSPGTILLANIIRHHLEAGYRELDMMGQKEASGKKQKSDWATGSHNLFQLKVFNHWAMLLSRLQRRMVRMLSLPNGGGPQKLDNKL